MEGGELFNRIQERAQSAFTERGWYFDWDNRIFCYKFKKQQKL
jgi:hypothetical protein